MLLYISKSMNKTVTLILDSDLIYYFINFSVDDGVLILDGANKTLFVDLRYYEGAKNLPNVTVILYSCLKEVFDYLKIKNVSKVGLVFEYSNAKTLRSLEENGFTVFDNGEYIFEKTSIKNNSEIERIKQSCKIAEVSYKQVLKTLKVGVTEREVASTLEYYFRLNGAEDKSFNTIVAFGKGSSIPHYKTGNVKLKNDMPVLFDFGCKYMGYCSDMSRSFYFGKAPQKYIQAHNAVYTAQQTAINGIKAGIKACEADAIARNYLKSVGLDKYFTHSLGHGIGVKIHEEPRLSKSGSKILQENSVFSVEPGVYFEGEFGIRIEDTVIIEGGKALSLMKDKVVQEFAQIK